MSNAIYKIARVHEWEDTVKSGLFTGSADDKRDGFIHFSTAAQVKTTWEKYFSTEERSYLVAVDPDCLGSSLKWEPSRGGQLFPHLYGPLLLPLVRSVMEIRCSQDGRPLFPPEIA